MSEIALYNLLRRIPDATDDEAQEAVRGHGDLGRLEGRVAKLEADVSAIKWMVGSSLAINVAFVVTAVSIMANFL